VRDGRLHVRARSGVGGHEQHRAGPGNGRGVPGQEREAVRPILTQPSRVTSGFPIRWRRATSAGPRLPRRSRAWAAMTVISQTAVANRAMVDLVRWTPRPRPQAARIEAKITEWAS